MSEEGALEKSGAELFRELLRVYPVAEVDDYFKAGQWKDEVMKVDLQLIEAHRKEAGAPDPIPLEEVTMPTLPKVLSVPGVQIPAGVGVRPVAPGVTPGLRPAGAVVSATSPAAPKAAGAVTPAAGPVSAGATTAAAGGPVAELRLIALFVAKWKLDPTRTKMMLAKMTPQRRRYVIQNFKTAVTGAEATNALEQYIATCEKTNAWGAATATATPATPGAVTPIAPRAVTPVVVAGVKRPLIPVSAAAGLDPSKRPRITPTVPAPKAAVVAPFAGGVRMPIRPQVVPGVRPTLVPGIRPVQGLPKAKAAGAKSGELIRNLLQRF